MVSCSGCLGQDSASQGAPFCKSASNTSTQRKVDRDVKRDPLKSGRMLLGPQQETTSSKPLSGQRLVFGAVPKMMQGDVTW